jgi:aldose 1-epimerase
MSENTITTEADDQNTEYLLHGDDLRLRVSPFGASVRGMWRGDDLVITEYRGAENNIGSQGDVLMPFPSRIPDGRYTFDGATHQLAVNDSGRPHAMHGFLRSALWETTERSDSNVTFSITVNDGDYSGYPFALRISVTYSLQSAGLRCDFHCENFGIRPAPFGAGFHPYFTVGSDIIDVDILEVPLREFLKNGEHVEVAGTRWDFRKPKPVGDAPCDAVYRNPVRDSDGLARVRYTSPDGNRAITLWMDQTFDYLVLYSGDTLPPTHQRRALAIEPWTCAPNAFNYPERGLTVLAPGESLSGSWGVVMG